MRRGRGLPFPVAPCSHVGLPALTPAIFPPWRVEAAQPLNCTGLQGLSVLECEHNAQQVQKFMVEEAKPKGRT